MGKMPFAFLNPRKYGWLESIIDIFFCLFRLYNNFIVSMCHPLLKTNAPYFCCPVLSRGFKFFGI